MLTSNLLAAKTILSFSLKLYNKNQILNAFKQLNPLHKL